MNKCSPVRRVSVLLGTSMSCRTMNELTLVRSHSTVGCVRRSLHVTTISKCTCGFTWARSPMSAPNATASSSRWLTCDDISVCTLERPYPCELCKSKFSDSNQLKSHMLIHKGEKPFKCIWCQRRFRRRQQLLHHKCSSKKDK